MQVEPGSYQTGLLRRERHRGVVERVAVGEAELPDQDADPMRRLGGDDGIVGLPMPIRDRDPLQEIVVRTGGDRFDPGLANRIASGVDGAPIGDPASVDVTLVPVVGPTLLSREDRGQSREDEQQACHVHLSGVWALSPVNS